MTTKTTCQVATEQSSSRRRRERGSAPAQSELLFGTLSARSGSDAPSSTLQLAPRLSLRSGGSARPVPSTKRVEMPRSQDGPRTLTLPVNSSVSPMAAAVLDVPPKRAEDSPPSSAPGASVSRTEQRRATSPDRESVSVRSTSVASEAPAPKQHPTRQVTKSPSPRRRSCSSSSSSSSSSASSASTYISRSKVRSKRDRSVIKAEKRGYAGCGRCGKRRNVDLLDPTIAGLKPGRKERIRRELVTRLNQLRHRYPDEPIELPERGSDNAVVVHRRYRRVIRHLYGQRSISTYRMYLLGFQIVVQIALSVLLGPAAAGYLKKELDTVAKYDSVFYEMGCRSFSVSGESSSPEYRLGVQILMPVVLVIITTMVTRFTPLPPAIVNILGNMLTNYMGGDAAQTKEYKTLLDDDVLDEHETSSDEDSDDEEDEPDEKEKKEKKKPDEPRRGRVAVPDLEAALPDEAPVPDIIQKAIPGLVSMVANSSRPPPLRTGTSTRKEAEKGQQQDSGLSQLVGPLMSLLGSGALGQEPAAGGPRRRERGLNADRRRAAAAMRGSRRSSRRAAAPRAVPAAPTTPDLYDS